MEDPVPHFLDANIIIRYLTGDNPEQSARAYRLLQQVDEGSVHVTVSEAVVVEVVYVLSSKATYNLPRATVRDRVRAVVEMRGLELQCKRTYLRALQLYADTSIDFVDALCIAQMERAGITHIWSFDHRFDRLEGITREEP